MSGSLRGLIALGIALGLAGCPSKEAKLAEMKQQCLDGCARKKEVIALCDKHCAGNEQASCAEVFCKQPREAYDECEKCCEEKGSKPGFVLGSCLSKADLSETMTAEKRWEIWKKIVDQRLQREEKERASQARSDQLAAIEKAGWTVTSEADEAGGTTVFMVKEVGEPVDNQRPKLVLQCSAGAAEVYLQTIEAVKNGGGKVKAKLGVDGAAAAPITLSLAADQDTLAFAEAAAQLAAWSSAKALQFEFQAAQGGKRAIAIDLAGLPELLALNGKNCGL